eukprot:204733-Rhodomonas_salina.1
MSSSSPTTLGPLTASSTTTEEAPTSISLACSTTPEPTASSSTTETRSSSSSATVQEPATSSTTEAWTGSSCSAMPELSTTSSSSRTTEAPTTSSSSTTLGATTSASTTSDLEAPTRSPWATMQEPAASRARALALFFTVVLWAVTLRPKTSFPILGSTLLTPTCRTIKTFQVAGRSLFTTIAPCWMERKLTTHKRVWRSSCSKASMKFQRDSTILALVLVANLCASASAQTTWCTEQEQENCHDQAYCEGGVGCRCMP